MVSPKREPPQRSAYSAAGPNYDITMVRLSGGGTGVSWPGGRARHRHIEAVRWQYGEESTTSSVAEVVDWIEQGNRFFTWDGVTRSSVAVVDRGKRKPKLIRAHVDGSWTDDLLNLPFSAGFPRPHSSHAPGAVPEAPPGWRHPVAFATSVRRPEALPSGGSSPTGSAIVEMSSLSLAVPPASSAVGAEPSLRILTNENRPAQASSASPRTEKHVSDIGTGIRWLLEAATELERALGPVADDEQARHVRTRLRDSVLRPLRQVAGVPIAGSGSATDPTTEPPVGSPRPDGSEPDSAWQLHTRVPGLARTATQLRFQFRDVPELTEATAALQDLAVALAEAADAAELLAELAALQAACPRDPGRPQRPLPGHQRPTACATGSARMSSAGRRWRCAGAASRRSSRSATARTRGSGSPTPRTPTGCPTGATPTSASRSPCFDNRGICQHSGLLHRPAGHRCSTPARSRSSHPAAGGWTRSSGPCATARPAR